MKSYFVLILILRRSGVQQEEWGEESDFHWWAVLTARAVLTSDRGVNSVVSVISVGSVNSEGSVNQ